MTTAGSVAHVGNWEPVFSRWRHGGWYVSNVCHLGGACGCVSNNYPDKKWRIVDDPHRNELGAAGDFTFPSRHAAAVAEYEMAAAEIAEELRNWDRISDDGHYWQKVGDFEVHLDIVPDRDLGYGVFVMRGDETVKQARHSGCFEQALEWARDEVRELQKRTVNRPRG